MILAVSLAGIFVALIGVLGVLRERRHDMAARMIQPELPELRRKLG